MNGKFFTDIALFLESKGHIALQVESRDAWQPYIIISLDLNQAAFVALFEIFTRSASDAFCTK